MVMQVQSGLSFSGLTLQTTLVWQICFFLVGRDVVVVNEEESVGSVHSLGAWLGAIANALAETP